DIAQLRACQIGQLQVFEEQIQELRARQRKGELINQIALPGVTARTLPTTARALDAVALYKLPVAGVHGFAVAPLPMPERGFGNILDRQVDVRATVHVAHGTLVDQAADGLA